MAFVKTWSVFSARRVIAFLFRSAGTVFYVPMVLIFAFLFVMIPMIAIELTSRSLGSKVSPLAFIPDGSYDTNDTLKAALVVSIVTSFVFVVADLLLQRTMRPTRKQKIGWTLGAIGIVSVLDVAYTGYVGGGDYAGFAGLIGLFAAVATVCFLIREALAAIADRIEGPPLA
jgi:hypothetical protein